MAKEDKLKLRDGKPRKHPMERGKGVPKEREVDSLGGDRFLSRMGLLPTESVCVC